MWWSYVFLLPVTALKIQILVPSLWKNRLQRDQLREGFSRCQASFRFSPHLEHHFFLAEVSSSRLSPQARDEELTFGDLVVLPIPEEDGDLQMQLSRRKAAQTALGQQVLSRPAVAAQRLLHSLAWLMKEKMDFDLVLKVEDTSEVPLEVVFQQLLLNGQHTRHLLLGAIIEDFPLTVPEAPEPCETCEIPMEAELFCLEMIEVSMSGMDMRGCLRIATQCCSQSSCGREALSSCTAMAREVGMETILYFGTAFAPPFPEKTAWALGRGCVEFLTENLNDLKLRMDAPEILLGFWLAGLEDLKIVHVPEFSAG